MRRHAVVAGLAFGALLAHACPRPASGEDAMPKTERTRFLALDSRVIESAEGARLVLGKVTKHERNPLFAEEHPWEARFDNLYANVIYDGEDALYKCWYSPFIVCESTTNTPRDERAKRRYMGRHTGRRREMGVCYATSRDGITWTKPLMDIRLWDGAPTNIVDRGPHGAGVFKDLGEKDPGKRYKMFLKEKGICVAFSADGLHWSEPVPCPEAKAAGDTHNNAFRAPTLGMYVGITRTWAGKPRVRQVARTTSRDFLKWTKTKVVLQGIETHLQTYAMPVFFHGGVYLGLLAVHDQKRDRVHCELTWSPDTVEWHRICPGTPLIANSEEKGAYDWGCVYAGACPVFVDEPGRREIRIYYGGSNGLHFSWRDGFFCLATLRPDGFAGLEPVCEDAPAVVTTKPLGPRDGALRITADVGPGGAVGVSAVGERGKTLASYRPVEETVTDRALVPRRGRGRRPLREGARLRFELRRAKLYSFSFGE